MLGGTLVEYKQFEIWFSETVKLFLVGGTIAVIQSFQPFELVEMAEMVEMAEVVEMAEMVEMVESVEMAEMTELVEIFEMAEMVINTTFVIKPSKTKCKLKLQAWVFNHETSENTTLFVRHCTDLET